MLIFLTNVSFLLKIGLLNHHYVVVINPFIVDFYYFECKGTKIIRYFCLIRTPLAVWRGPKSRVGHSRRRRTNVL